MHALVEMSHGKAGEDPGSDVPGMREEIYGAVRYGAIPTEDPVRCKNSVRT